MQARSQIFLFAGPLLVTMWLACVVQADSPMPGVSQQSSGPSSEVNKRNLPTVLADQIFFSRPAASDESAMQVERLFNREQTTVSFSELGKSSNKTNVSYIDESIPQRPPDSVSFSELGKSSNKTNVSYVGESIHQRPPDSVFFSEPNPFFDETDTAQSTSLVGPALPAYFSPSGSTSTAVPLVFHQDAGAPRLLSPTAPRPLARKNGATDTRSTRTAGDDQTLGEAPQETDADRQFLRQDSILLDPGQYQIDMTLQYLFDEKDFVLAQTINGNLQIDEARQRRRLLLVPIEFRLGLTSNLQGFINVPFGWSNTEFIFGATDEFSNNVGIGDVSAGLTRILFDGKVSPSKVIPLQILGNLSFSAPTGKSSFASSLSSPGSSLGRGSWSVSSALTFIHTYDPLVAFYGFGLSRPFESTIDGFSVKPGQQIFYRFGVGFAVNPKVTLSTSFIGSFIGETKVNGIGAAGSMIQPTLLRFAATFVKSEKSGRSKISGNKASGSGKKRRAPVRTIEPFVNFGLTEDSIDVLFGISRTF